MVFSAFCWGSFAFKLLCDLLRIRLYSDLDRLRLCRSTLSTRILFLLVRPLPHLSDGWVSLARIDGRSLERLLLHTSHFEFSTCWISTVGVWGSPTPGCSLRLSSVSSLELISLCVFHSSARCCNVVLLGVLPDLTISFGMASLWGVRPSFEGVGLCPSPLVSMAASATRSSTYAVSWDRFCSRHLLLSVQALSCRSSFWRVPRLIYQSLLMVQPFCFDLWSSRAAFGFYAASTFLCLLVALWARRRRSRPC